jgi:hypothetical protein
MYYLYFSVSGRLLTSFMQLHMVDYFKKVLQTPLNVVVKGNVTEFKMGSQEVQPIIDGFTDLIDAIFNSDSQCPVYVEGDESVENREGVVVTRVEEAPPRG